MISKFLANAQKRGRCQMHITKQPSAAMKWLEHFLNFDPNGSESDRYGAIDVVKALQQKWSRLLNFIAEPKGRATSLAESLQVAIWMNENLIKSHQGQINELADELRKNGEDPGQNERLAVLKDEIAEYQKNISRMQSFLRLGEEKISKQAAQIRKELKGATYMTPAEALEKLVKQLNVWSLGKDIHPVWKLRRLEKNGRYTQPGQGALFFGGEKFTVDSELTRRKLEDAIYSNVAKCLETGEFDRLRRCQHPECRRFFFAHHFRQLHCKPEHQRLHDAQRAGERMKKYRHKREKLAKNQGVPRLLKLATSNLSDIRDFFAEKFEEFIPFAEKIKSGARPTQVWRTLPRRLRKQLVQNDPLR